MPKSRKQKLSLPMILGCKKCGYIVRERDTALKEGDPCPNRKVHKPFVFWMPWVKGKKIPKLPTKPKVPQCRGGKLEYRCDPSKPA